MNQQIPKPYVSPEGTAAFRRTNGLRTVPMAEMESQTCEWQIGVTSTPVALIWQRRSGRR